MKKIVIVAIALLTFAGANLFAQAQFRPYGSARVGYWYNNQDDDWSGIEGGRLNLDYYLQSNSRFGARFSDGDKSGRVEFGGTGSIRLLWASYDMEGYKILIGQDETLLTQKGTMNWGSENNFVGWGAIDNSRQPQVRFDFKNGLSLGFVKPEVIDMEHTGYDDSQRIDMKEKQSLLPKLNVGFKNKLSDNISFSAALGTNLFSYGTDAGLYRKAYNDGEEDVPEELLHDLDGEMLISFVAAVMLDMKFDDIGVKLHGNFGQNTGNYGLGTYDSRILTNKAIWDTKEKEIVDVTTMGGFGELSYKTSDKSLATVGASYTMSNSDLYDETDTAMAAFLQFRYDLGKNFRISPEVGLLDKMQDKNGNDRGSLIYFGTQLRIDF